MKKVKLFTLALMAMFSMGAWAETIFSFTATSETLTQGSYDAVGGSAVLSGSNMSSGGSNEVLVGEQTFYKFNSSSKWTFSLADNATFAEGDVITVTAACQSGSNKSGKGVKFNAISVTGDFPKGESNDLVYTVVAEDGIAGANSFEMTRADSDIKFGTIVIDRPGPSCEAPAEALSLTTPLNAYFVGENVSLNIAGGNGEDIALTLDGEAFTGTSWLAAGVGDHTFVATQEVSEGGVCGGVAQVTISVSATNPVTTFEIDGPVAETAFIGQAVTLKAVNFDAAPTEIKWYDTNYNELSITDSYSFTPDAAGDYLFYITAYNQFNAVNEEAFLMYTLHVTKLCGELITATLNGGTSATMGGVIGGTFDTNLGSGKYKLDKGKYIGVQLASGTFSAGDVVTITMSTAGQNYPCLFGDKDRTNLLFLAEEVSEATEYQIVLPAAASGLTSIYLSRDADDATYKWNPTVSSISVSRSCEASSNADITAAYAEGEMALSFDEETNTFSGIVPATVNLAQVTITYTLDHPLASATPASGFVMDVPTAGAAANTQNIVVTAEDGTNKTYIISISKAAAASDVATLSALAVNGYTLDPAFDPEVVAYNITKAYGAANPSSTDIELTLTDPASHDHIETLENSFVITVTAEDGVTQKVYTINILTAAAPKDLLEVSFSNGVHGFIKAGEIKVPYIAGAEAPTYVESIFASGVEGASAQLEEDGLKVIGADADEVVYSIVYEAVPVADIQLENTITFDSTENYIYSVYGWDAAKGWKIAKDVEEAANKRISEGKDRLYMALPAADSLYLTSGSGKDRPVRITVNGVASDVVKLAKQNEEVAIALNASANNFVCIESNGSNGDGGIIAIRLHKNDDTPSALDEAVEAEKAHKVVRDGQIIIIRGDKEFNLVGAEL